MIELAAGYDICVVRADGFFHPLAAVYRLTVLPTITRLLAEDRRRPQFLFDEVPTRVVSAVELSDIDPGLKSLQNLNTPAEYEAAVLDSYR